MEIDTLDKIQHLFIISSGIYWVREREKSIGKPHAAYAPYCTFKRIPLYPLAILPRGESRGIIFLPATN